MLAEKRKDREKKEKQNNNGDRFGQDQVYAKQGSSSCSYEKA